MSWLSDFVSTNGAALLYGMLSGALGWFGANFVGKPVIELREKRQAALHAADRYGHVGWGASEETIVAARRALSDAASALRAVSRTGNLTLDLYCKSLQMDLELAAKAIDGLGTMIGGPHDNVARQRQLDAIHFCLHAYRHLSAKRLQEIQDMLDEAKSPDNLSAREH